MTATTTAAIGFEPCGCLRNSRGAHRGDCPDFETIRPYEGCNRLDELTWRPRAETPR